MKIIEPGNPLHNKKDEFSFTCKQCGCKWEASRGDKGLGISPPCMEFFIYMNCPNCEKFTKGEENQ